MESLQEHNENFFKRYQPPPTEELCNVACPTCGVELWRDLTIILTSNPPQSRVRCKGCGYSGSIY